MTLEDHVGDVVRKARHAANVSAEAAARAAGLTAAEWNAWEQSGAVPTRANMQALAEAVGLNGAKLAELAQGWVPARVDLSTWRELRWMSNTRGGNTVNCYLVWDEVTR